MSVFSATGILLRRTDYSDNDLIVTLLTRECGKMSVMAKSAKKSRKRFAGLLEPFACLQIVCQNGRGGSLPFLQEASLLAPHTQLRTDIASVAYAGYWAELVEAWAEERERQTDLFQLLDQSFEALDSGRLMPELLSLQFQMKLLKHAGVFPDLRQCIMCGQDIDTLPPHHFTLLPDQGGMVCRKCDTGAGCSIALSKGSIKQLLWLADATPDQARRLRFSGKSLKECTAFAEAFTPFHLGRSPKSLEFLKQIRSVYNGQ